MTHIKLKDQLEPSENGKDFNPDAKDISFFRDRRIKILKREEAEKLGLRYLTYVPGMAVGHAFWRFSNHFSQHVDYVEAISLEKYDKDKIGQEGAVKVEFWVNEKDNLLLHEKKHLLFVCTSAMDRSPCAANLFRSSKEYEAKFAGISPGAEVALTKEAIVWADIIFTMEPEHQRYVLKSFKQEIKAGLKEVILLDIGNDFNRYDEELEEELRNKLVKEGFL